MKNLLLRLMSLLVICSMTLAVLASCTFSVGPAPSTSTETTTDETTTTDHSEDTPRRNPYDDIDTYTYVIGNTSLVYDFTDKDEADLRAVIDELEKAIADGTDADRFSDCYDSLDTALTHLVSQYQLAYIEYCIFNTDEEATENYLYISELQNEMEQYEASLYRTIYDSEFRDVFYEDWTEEEIQEALEYSDAFTDELVIMKNLEEQQLIEYRANPFETEDDLAAIRELYIEFAKNQSNIAAQYGYENYMEYAYDYLYSRDYSVTEAEQMVEYVKTYIAPLISDLMITFNANMESMDNAAYNDLLAILFGNGSLTSGSTVRRFSEYYEALSDISSELYSDMMDNGYYFISYDESSYQGAFSWYLHEQSHPIMYFGGEDYITPLTFAHEFGHYMAFEKDTAEYQNLDLAEVQSQGDEMLYLTYLYNEFNSTAVDTAIIYQLLNTMFIFTSSICVNAFETYVYQNIDEITADDLDEIYMSVIEEIFGYETLTSISSNPELYWYYVTIESPGYYISYSMSLVPALELLAYANEDFDLAAEAYMQLVCNSMDGFCEPLTEAELYTPFEEDAYVMISEYISQLLSE